MNLPTRWNPLRQITRFDPIEDIFSSFGLRPLSREFQSTMNNLEMRMDVSEDDKSYAIRIDIPGVNKDDIDVLVEGTQVTISTEIKRDKPRDNDKDLYSERYVGKAYRSFSLPFEVDSGKADARYENGVLTLTLPKTASAVSKRLSVH